MPFPFLPVGAIVAASVLIGALAIFGLILKTMDRAAVGLRDMAVSSIASGLKSWGGKRPGRIATESPGSTPSRWSASGDPGSTTPLDHPEAIPTESPEIIDLGTRSI